MELYNNIFIETEKNIVESDLLEIEENLKFKFPNDIKRHYLFYNGGYPERYVFRKNDKLYVVQEFLPIKYGAQGCLFEDTFIALKKEKKILPDYLIPFAINPGGDYYCFSINENELGAIYIFFGEFDDPKRSIIFLSISLKDFVMEMIEEE